MAYPLIGSLPISQISLHEVLAVLRNVEATGRYESANAAFLAPSEASFINGVVLPVDSGWAAAALSDL